MSEEKKGFFGRLKAGLTKTRENIVKGIDSVFSGFSAIDEDFYEELEEILIMGDIGVNATADIIQRLICWYGVRNSMEMTLWLICRKHIIHWMSFSVWPMRPLSSC